MKNKFAYFAFMFMLICLMCFLPHQEVLAKSFENNNAILTTEEGGEGEVVEEPTDPTTEEKIYEDLKKGGYELNNSSDIEDNNLYSALLQVIKQYIKDTYDGYIYTDSTLYNTMFKKIETIDIRSMDIKTLNGIEKIRFDSLKSLSVVDNQITEIKSTYFERMPNLEVLDLSNNKIKSVDVTGATKLNKINFSSNNIEKINLSFLTSTNIDVNLSNNIIMSMTDIGLPTRAGAIHLNIINNNIADLTEEYFEYDRLTMNIGVQGIVGKTSTKVFDTSTDIAFYKTNLAGVYMKIYKCEVGDILYKTITDADIAGNCLLEKFEVGEYLVEYYLGDNPLYVALDSEKTGFKTYNFKVNPTACTFKYEFKGKIYDKFDEKVTGKVKVLLSCEEGAEIYYKVGGSDWTKGNEIMCDKGGNYSITAKVVKDGYESEEANVLIMTSLNTVVPDILMLILVLLFTLTLFLIVVPIVSKKWFKN